MKTGPSVHTPTSLIRSISKPIALTLALAVVAAPATHAIEEPDFDEEVFNECVLERIRDVSDTMLVREIKDACLEVARGEDTTQTQPTESTEEATPLEARIEETEATQELAFVITPYKPNYVLVGYNPDPNEAPWQEAFPDEDIELDAAEIKFQISFMFPLVRNIVGDNGHLYIAYTNRSFWQAFNQEESLPFRETNHEPEFFFRFDSQWKFLGFTNRLNSFGFVHQSNGRNEPISRSWNRLFASFIFERNNFAFSIKPWIIIGDKIGNEDIEDYMGNVEFRGVYKWRRNTFSLLLRNNLQSSFSKGTFQTDWSFPIHKRLRGYVQYFNGYGESLIDYNDHNNTLGLGFQLTDYF
jgi:phospholipase A1